MTLPHIHVPAEIRSTLIHFGYVSLASVALAKGIELSSERSTHKLMINLWPLVAGVFALMAMKKRNVFSAILGATGVFALAAYGLETLAHSYGRRAVDGVIITTAIVGIFFQIFTRNE